MLFIEHFQGNDSVFQSVLGLQNQRHTADSLDLEDLVSVIDHRSHKVGVFLYGIHTKLPSF